MAGGHNFDWDVAHDYLMSIPNSYLTRDKSLSRNRDPELSFDVHLRVDALQGENLFEFEAADERGDTNF